MEAELWQRVETLFHRSRRLTGGDREAFLGSIPDTEPELRREVASLLAAYDQASSFLERSTAAGVTVPGAAADAGEWVGRRLGAYVILREIGRGGMSVVFLAARDDEQFQRLVALKILAPFSGRGELLQRFVQERQILAALDHPNIARLYDGGATEGGTPYLVMELIEGLPIDEYCDGKRLTIDQRIDLFLQVCGAVQHAHGRLVVHRDLKPSNVLVDAAGHPKLLDFGIAKLLDPEIAAGQLAATTLARPMTPGYASPEQILGQPITTATDVYTLGVLLNRLLTGHSPYRRPPHQPIEKTILEREPTAPSLRVADPEERTDGTAGAESPDALAARRRSRPRRLAQKLRGDLDNIVLTALRKDPERRYGSVELLSEDLRRYRAAMPISARPDTWSYRLFKFLGRNRLAAGLAAATFLLAVASAVVMALLASHSTLQRDEARAAQQRAERVKTFLIDVLRAVDPGRSPDHARTVDELLVQSLDRAKEELDGEPAVQVEVLTTLGEIHRRRGNYATARSAFEQAVELERRAVGAEALTVAALLTALADIEGLLGNVEDALPLQTQALEIQRRSLPPDDPVLARSLGVLAGLYRLAGQEQRAVDLHRQAIAIWRLQPDERLGLAESLNDLAVVRSNLGGESEAEELYGEALAIKQDVLGRDHPDIAVILNNLGTLAAERRQTAAAAELLREALQILLRAVGDHHPNVAGARNKLATVLMEMERFDEAEELFGQALAARREGLGNRHPAVAVSLSGLANLHLRQGSYLEAERHFRESLAIAREAFPGGRFTGLAFPLLGLAKALRLQGGAAPEVRALAAEAAAIRDRALPANDRLVTQARCELARSQLALADFAAAEANLRSHLAALDGTTGSLPQQAEATLELLAELYQAWPRPDRAAEVVGRLEQLRSAGAVEGSSPAPREP